jgi:hypothetical protein
MEGKEVNFKYVSFQTKIIVIKATFSKKSFFIEILQI